MADSPQRWINLTTSKASHLAAEDKLEYSVAGVTKITPTKRIFYPWTSVRSVVEEGDFVGGPFR